MSIGSLMLVEKGVLFKFLCTGRYLYHEKRVVFMLPKIDTEIIERILAKARESPRKRAIYSFSKPKDRMQRMVNAALKDTYVRPHKHENPDKLEVWSILRGRLAVLTFNEKGDITEKVVLDSEGDIKAVEIPPRTWHSFVVLTNEAAIHEIIDSRYNAKTHKTLATWAPEEGTKEGVVYLEKIRKLMGLF
jgi:cupin fold WbuC family metalloprotein